MDKPTITREETADGWKVTADYGAQGVGTSIVHIAAGTPEEARKNRLALDRVLGRLGYTLKGEATCTDL